MAPPVVMIVRHAEKPADDGSAPYGIDSDGNQSKHDLLVRGWQRAGGLARLFAPYPAGTAIRQGLSQPGVIYAAAPAKDGGEGKSCRSIETVSVLAAQLGLTTNLDYGPTETGNAAQHMREQAEPVLAAWEHHNIAGLVTALTDGTVVPPHWSGSRFDMVLVLTPGDAGWRLEQVPQMLLPGDSTQPLPPGP